MVSPTKKLAIVPLLAALLAIPSINASNSLPTMGEFSGISMNPETEYELGQQLLTKLRLQLPLIEDSIVNDYLNNLGAHLVSATDNSHFPFTFFVIDAPSINAFAAPGGIIVIHSGLINAADNESELAAVIAHEISHVTQRHIARFYDQSGQSTMAAMAGLVGAILLSSYSPAAAQASLYAGMAAGASSDLKFSREHEQEADRQGKEVLSEAGYDTGAIGSFFKKLQQASHSDPTQVSEFLQTHPLPASRISDAWIPQSSASSGIKDSPAFPFIKARVQHLTKRLNHRTDKSTDNKSNSYHYAKALESLRLKQAGQARTHLDKITSAKPKPQLYVNLLRAESYLIDHQPARAEVLLTPIFEAYPSNPAIVELLATSYLENDKPLKSYELLQTFDIKNEAWLPLLKLKADAASQSGKDLASHETLALWYEYRGQYSLALEQILVAQKTDQGSEVSRIRLDSREQALRDKLSKHRDKPNI